MTCYVSSGIRSVEFVISSFHLLMMILLSGNLQKKKKTFKNVVLGSLISFQFY